MSGVLVSAQVETLRLPDDSENIPHRFAKQERHVCRVAPVIGAIRSLSGSDDHARCPLDTVTDGHRPDGEPLRGAVFQCFNRQFR